MIGERLKDLRTKKELTQQQLGEKLGVSSMTISNYENEVRIPDGKFIVDAAEYFNVTSDYLLGIVNSSSRENRDIGQITGLSENAIACLKLYNEQFHNEAAELVNYITTLVPFNKLLQLLRLRFTKPTVSKLNVKNMTLQELATMKSEREIFNILCAVFPEYCDDTYVRAFQIERCLDDILQSLTHKYAIEIYGGNPRRKNAKINMYRRIE